MKLRNLTLLLLSVALPFALHAAGNVDGYNEATIRASDIPDDAPLFSAYPTKVFTGPNAKLHVGKDPEAGRYKTRLREWSKHKVNFAGQ